MMGLSLVQICLVGIAGALGALARYLLGRVIAERVSSQFPLGTLIINVSGALLIGVIAGVVGHKMISTNVQFILATGFLGGYTTFSTMSWEGAQLIQGRSLVRGALYLGGVFALGVPAVALGMALGRWL